MKSAELKETSKTKGKRVKHCFRRAEIYHQWIHDDKFVYTNQRYNVAGHYDLLFAGTLNGNSTRKDLTEFWGCWRNESCIAVINRDKKLILVSLKYTLQSSELLNDIPDDYQVFLTEDKIPNPDILSTGELDEVIKIHASFLVKKFVETTLSEPYLVLKGKAGVLHDDPKTLFKYDKSKYETYYRWHYHYRTEYNNIVDFVNKYKVKKYDWYKEPIKGQACIERWTNWSNKEYAHIDLPSVKQVITDRVFSSKEKVQLAQSYFYGKYCHGYGISRKEIISKWTTPYDREELEARFKKVNVQINLDDRPNLIFWIDGIKLYYKAMVANNEAYVKRCEEQSVKNELEAYDKLAKENSEASLEAFRNFEHYSSNHKIEYQRYWHSYRKGSLGMWKTDYVCFHNTFANTQLRLKDDIIETSRFAKVPLSAAIDMWRLYKAIVNKHEWKENTDYIVRFDDKHINIGIYNLRAIMYSKKKTDQNVVLDRYEWCVVISCHYLWIDDFMDFVKYYNLYDKFGIDNPIPVKDDTTSKNNVKPFKIKIK